MVTFFFYVGNDYGHKNEPLLPCLFLVAGKCQVDVDLVDIKQVDKVFAIQIILAGVLLDCADENEFIKQRMKAYPMYATQNEQKESKKLIIRIQAI